MKAALLLFAFVLFAQVLFGQTTSDYIDCGTPEPDSATAVSVPWYGNNQFLYNYLSSEGYYGNTVSTMS